MLNGGTLISNRDQCRLSPLLNATKKNDLIQRCPRTLASMVADGTRGSHLNNPLQRRWGTRAYGTA